MNWLERLQIALDQSRSHSATWGEHQAIRSIVVQLEYLIGLATGETRDRSKLRDISIGVLAVREIEIRDAALAELLEAIAAEARRGGRTP